MTGYLSDCCNAQVMGNEVRGVYDGILFWSCENCDYAWPRRFGSAVLDKTSQDYADDYNRGDYKDVGSQS